MLRLCGRYIISSATGIYIIFHSSCPRSKGRSWRIPWNEPDHRVNRRNSRIMKNKVEAYEEDHIISNLNRDTITFGFAEERILCIDSSQRFALRNQLFWWDDANLHERHGYFHTVTIPSMVPASCLTCCLDHRPFDSSSRRMCHDQQENSPNK